MNISLLVKNIGNLEGNFSITIYAGNTTITELAITIALKPHETKMLSVLWNTTDFSKGEYKIKAEATVHPLEAVEENNVLLSPKTVIITIIGDITGDRKVDIKDIAKAARAFGLTPWDPEWDPDADLTGDMYGVPDGSVNIKDILLITRAFGKEDP